MTNPPASSNPADVVQQLSKDGVLRLIATYLKPSIVDLFHFAISCKAALRSVGTDYVLWRDVYLTNEPLSPKEYKKRLLKDSYCDHKQLLTTRSGLQISIWMRTCSLIFRKPRLVLVLGGRDPVMVRRLGQGEGALQRVNLGINYHLDSYLDEDESRFATEFPQLFQDLDVGDIVVTQDYRGAGCWTVFPPGTPLPKPATPRPALQLPNPPWKPAAESPPSDPAPSPTSTAAAVQGGGSSSTTTTTGGDPTCITKIAGEGWPVLRKNEYDSSGYGILTEAVAPPTYPLFYYCEEPLAKLGPGPLDRAKLAAKQVYWFGYSRLKDGALFSWGDLQICDE